MSGTPGTATKLGDSGAQTGNVEKGKGIGTAYYREHYGAQKADVSFFLWFFLRGFWGFGGGGGRGGGGEGGKGGGRGEEGCCDCGIEKSC